MKTGDRFGRVVVLKLVRTVPGAKLRARVQCDCGKRKEVQAGNLQSGHTTSCGCYHRERVVETHTRHGHSRDTVGRTATYEAWRSMIKNCYTPSAGSYANYGGLGITVCRGWQGTGGFERFLDDMGEKPSEAHQLSRRDKKKPFTLANTFWATDAQVRRNTRQTTMYTVGHRTQCLVDWANEYDIPKNTLHYRVVTKGMSMRDALDVGRGTQGKLLPC